MEPKYLTLIQAAAIALLLTIVASHGPSTPESEQQQTLATAR